MQIYGGVNFFFSSSFDCSFKNLDEPLYKFTMNHLKKMNIFNFKEILTGLSSKQKNLFRTSTIKLDHNTIHAPSMQIK